MKFFRIRFSFAVRALISHIVIFSLFETYFTHLCAAFHALHRLVDGTIAYYAIKIVIAQLEPLESIPHIFIFCLEMSYFSNFIVNLDIKRVFILIRIKIKQAQMNRLLRLDIIVLHLFNFVGI